MATTIVPTAPEVPGGYPGSVRTSDPQPPPYTPSSLVSSVDWLQPLSPSYEATTLIARLINLLATEICALRQNTHTSYRFMDTALSYYRQINSLIENVDRTANWDDFATYTAAIQPLEDALIEFQLEDMVDQGMFLGSLASVNEGFAFFEGMKGRREKTRDSLVKICTHGDLLALLKPPSGGDNNLPATHEQVNLPAYENDDRMFIDEQVATIQSYLTDKEATVDLPPKVRSLFHDISSGIHRIIEWLFRSSSESRPEHAMELTTKVVVTIRIVIEIGSNQDLPLEKRLPMRSEQTWQHVAWVVNGILQYLQNQKGYVDVQAVYDAFIAYITGPETALGVEMPLYANLLKLVAHIGRTYHAQATTVVRLCHEAATHYRTISPKSEKQHNTLQSALDKSLEVLEKCKEEQSQVAEMGLTKLEEFDFVQYDEGRFEESGKEIAVCFKVLGLAGSVEKLKMAREMDKKQMLAVNERIKRIKTPIEADPNKLVEVTVKVRRTNWDGVDLGEYKVRVQRSTRLTAIGWSASKDDSLKNKLSGHEYRFEQELTGQPAATKLLAASTVIKSLTRTTQLTLLMIVPESEA